MENGSLISIIVPAYNVERYLSRCLDSLINQTYTNIEIIIVDDGAKDNTPNICDSYEKMDIRVHCYHKSNGGLSDARNFGLEYATGDYLTFIDSDDYVSLDYVKTLYELIIENNADISICNFEKVAEGKRPCGKNDGETLLFSQDECMTQLLEGAYGLQFSTAWGKLFKRGVFRDIRFPIGKVHEDIFVAHHWYNNASIVAYTTKQLYYYMFREDSITSKERAQLFTNSDLLDAVKEKMLFFSSWNEGKYLNKGYATYVTMCLGVYPRLDSQLNSNRRLIREDMRRIYTMAVQKEISLKPHLKRRIHFFIVFPHIYSWFIRLIK